MNLRIAFVSSSSLDTPDTAGEAGEVPGRHGLQAELLQHEAVQPGQVAGGGQGGGAGHLGQGGGVVPSVHQS